MSEFFVHSEHIEMGVFRLASHVLLLSGFSRWRNQRRLHLGRAVLEHDLAYSMSASMEIRSSSSHS